MEHFGIPGNRVTDIPEGPSHIFRIMSDACATNLVLGRYGLTSGERFLLYVGGISPHKNLGVLIDAFHRLVTDHLFADVKLVLVGDYQGDTFLFSLSDDQG